MELGTFGAILGFALEMEQRAVDFYANRAQEELKGLFEDLASGSKKREIRIERTRREGITEIILEPISGLDSKDFLITLSADDDVVELLKQAIALEECTGRFYEAAAGKLPVREVVRTFKRMARDSWKRKAKLEELSLSPT
jgi:rubrerythrin